MRLRRRLERDLDRDIREHIEMETRDLIERGIAPDAARLAALRRFGSVLRATEETRAVWRWGWVDRLAQDVRYAVRGLSRNPVFSAVAILTLALGIGMNTAVFSVVSAALIRPLPYPDADRIVWLANYIQRFHMDASSAPDFTDWRAESQSFEAMAGYGTVDRTIQDGDFSAKHSFVYITPEFWRIAGVQPAIGRLYSESDQDGVVLTWRLFEQRFSSNVGVLGRVVTVDGKPQTIIGVLPKGFRFLPPPGMAGGMSGEAEAFTPNVITPQMRARGRSFLVMFVVGKLKAGVSRQQAQAELRTIQDRIAAANPALRNFYAGAEMRVVPLQERLVGESRRALLILLGAVAFVLLIVCVNLGNLLLARATARQRETAVRVAIGAGRNRLVGQFIVEGLTLACAGGIAGLGVARIANTLLVRLNPTAVPRLDEIAIDWRVLAFALGISLMAGVAFGLAPILSVPMGSLYSVLKEGGRISSVSTAGLLIRRLLVAAELAMALVLLTGAGLMAKSFVRMYAHPSSFQPEKIGMMRVYLSGPAYRERPAALSYEKRLLASTSLVPGVETVAVTEGAGSGAVEVEGPPRFQPGQAPQVTFRGASASYPAVVGIPLLKGRWTRDDEAGFNVVVNETFVKRVFGKDNPLGQKLRIQDASAMIVGVVGDLKLTRLDAEPEPEVLVPYAYTPVFRVMDILIKTSGSPASVLPAVRRAVQNVDVGQPPFGITTLDSALSKSIAARRFNFLLLGTFAASAVLLALIGIYGVMSYMVTQRTREIGVRMALGAQRGEIVRLVVRQGMLVAVVGIVAGTVAALGLTRLMSSLLFHVKPDDPVTFAVVAVGLAVTALMASWVPAFRAARVDPLSALRHE